MTGVLIRKGDLNTDHTDIVTTTGGHSEQAATYRPRTGLKRHQTC